MTQEPFRYRLCCPYCKREMTWDEAWMVLGSCDSGTQFVACRSCYHICFDRLQKRDPNLPIHEYTGLYIVPPQIPSVVSPCGTCRWVADWIVRPVAVQPVFMQDRPKGERFVYQGQVTEPMGRCSVPLPACIGLDLDEQGEVLGPEYCPALSQRLCINAQGEVYTGGKGNLIVTCALYQSKEGHHG